MSSDQTTRRLTICEALAQAMRDLPPDDQSAEALIEAMRKYDLYVARVVQRTPSGFALIEETDDE